MALSVRRTAACRFHVAGATLPQRSRAAASIASRLGSAPAASSAAVSAASVSRYERRVCALNPGPLFDGPERLAQGVEVEVRAR